MTWTVTIAGQTFSNASVEGNAYADEATGFPAILAAVAEEGSFLKGYGATSTTSLSIATGAKSFTLDQSPSWSVGAILRAESAGDPAKYMVGAIASLAGTALDLTVTLTGGSGSVSDWVISYPSTVSIALSGTATGAIDMTGYAISNPVLDAATGQVTDLDIEARGNTGATLTIAAANYDVQSCTMDQDTTLDFDPTASGNVRTILLLVSQDGTGGRTPTINFNSLATNITEMNTVPTWTGPAASTLTRVAAEVETGKMRIWYEEVA